MILKIMVLFPVLRIPFSETRGTVFANWENRYKNVRRGRDEAVEREGLAGR